jgi:hypothetical protein
MFTPKLFFVLAAALIASACSPSYAGKFADNHPRREQVIDRNQGTRNRLNADKGELGGHYGQLKAENRAIHRQEKIDARANGGYITKGEQRQLNREHNHLNKQIRRDHQ